MRRKSIIGGLLVLVVRIQQAYVVPINLFMPYDVMIRPAVVSDKRWHVNFGYEGMYDIHAYQADDTGSCNKSLKRNVLKIYQDEQDALAALKGAQFGTDIGTFAQLFNINDDDGTQALFVPSAQLTVPFSGTMAIHWRLMPHNVYLGFYMPFYYMKLRDVHFKEIRDASSFETFFDGDLIEQMRQLGGLCLGPWKRAGFGDVACRFGWARDFIQVKPLLRNVRVHFFAGLTFPTGKKSNQNELIAMPFGADGSAGIGCGGTLELWFKHNVRFLLDVDLLHLFGRSGKRRIKTDENQTDLFLLNKVCTYRQPGFTQHFTLGLGRMYMAQCFSLEAAYQYTKHNDDTLYICAPTVNPQIVNDAQYIREWTIHNAIVKGTYEIRPSWEHARGISLAVLYKNGFNGKRAFLGQSFTLECAVSF